MAKKKSTTEPPLLLRAQAVLSRSGIAPASAVGMSEALMLRAIDVFPDHELVKDCVRQHFAERKAIDEDVEPTSGPELP